MPLDICCQLIVVSCIFYLCRVLLIYSVVMNIDWECACTVCRMEQQRCSLSWYMLYGQIAWWRSWWRLMSYDNKCQLGQWWATMVHDISGKFWFLKMNIFLLQMYSSNFLLHDLLMNCCSCLNIFTKTCMLITKSWTYLNIFRFENIFLQFWQCCEQYQ